MDPNPGGAVWSRVSPQPTIQHQVPGSAVWSRASPQPTILHQGIPVREKHAISNSVEPGTEVSGDTELFVSRVSGTKLLSDIKTGDAHARERSAEFLTADEGHTSEEEDKSDPCHNGAKSKRAKKRLRHKANQRQKTKNPEVNLKSNNNKDENQRKESRTYPARGSASQRGGSPEFN